LSKKRYSGQNKRVKLEHYYSRRVIKLITKKKIKSSKPKTRRKTVKKKISKSKPCESKSKIKHVSHKSFNYIVMLEEDFDLKIPNRRKVKVGRSSSFNGTIKRYQQHKKGYTRAYILRIWSHKKCFERDMKMIFGMFAKRIGNTNRDEYFLIDSSILSKLVEHYDNILDKKIKIPFENQNGWWKK